MKTLIQRRNDLAVKLAKMTPEEYCQNVRNEAAHTATMNLSEGNVRLQSGRFLLVKTSRCAQPA